MHERVLSIDHSVSTDYISDMLSRIVVLRRAGRVALLRRQVQQGTVRPVFLSLRVPLLLASLPRSRPQRPTLHHLTGLGLLVVDIVSVVPKAHASLVEEATVLVVISTSLSPSGVAKEVIWLDLVTCVVKDITDIALLPFYLRKQCHWRGVALKARVVSATLHENVSLSADLGLAGLDI